MFLIKRESQLNNSVLILFLKLVDVLALERVPNHFERILKLADNIFFYCSMTTEMGNKVFKNMTMEEQSLFFFHF